MESVSSPSTPMRVLEFYSGIGGMRFALEQAGVSASVVEAFDINNTANDVYEHNFAHRPNQGNIQHLTSQQLDNYKADAWLLSPPCQPYTRQGLQKDADDARASSFLKLLEMLSLMSGPPTHLFVENVVGFECSISHEKLVKSLEEAGFLMQEFILTPLQFGIPYSRPRYFCLAKKVPFQFQHPQFNGQLLCWPGPLALFSEIIMADAEPSEGDTDQLHQSSKIHEPVLDPFISCRSICEYLEAEQLLLEEGSKALESNKVKSWMLSCYKVPETLIDRWGDAFDIVTPLSKRCCCFTKSYGRFVKGTGSFLATKIIEDLDDSITLKNKSLLKQCGLRYFTPREIANLHSFPKEFNFPDYVSLKQRYALLGNSLNVAVVASLLQYLLSTGNNGSMSI